MIYGEGCDKFGDILDVAEEMGIIRRSGAYYYYNSDKNFAKSRDDAKKFLRGNPDMFEEISQKVYELLKKGVKPVEVESETVEVPPENEQNPPPAETVDEDSAFSADGDEI